MERTPKTLARLVASSLLLIGFAGSSQPLLAFSGTEGASFLDIPVGGRPAALGGAYGPEASDAYAPIYNPGGLGLLQTTELAGMHISYLDSINYEYATFVHPFTPGNSMGISAQYLNPGQTTGRNDTGGLTGDFGGHYGAYSLAYGHHIGDRFGLGATAKFIESKIADASAHAYAFDLGAMARPTEHVSLSAVVTNLGSKLKYIDQSDPLPRSYRLGASYAAKRWLLMAEGLRESSGLWAARTGLEWTPIDFLSLRVGYKTETTRQLSAMAGFTTGVGLHVFGQEFDYAWVPVGDLGDTHYFSIVLRFRQSEPEKRNLVYTPGSHPRIREAEQVYYEPPMPDLDGTPSQGRTQGASGSAQ